MSRADPARARGGMARVIRAGRETKTERRLYGARSKRLESGGCGERCKPMRCAGGKYARSNTRSALCKQASTHCYRSLKSR
eukprot:4175110-Pyramimonas_sp.AAC.1